MTQRIFDVLDYCTTWLNSYRWGIFQDRYLKVVWTNIPDNENKFYKGMWLYVSANADIVFRETGEMADEVVICPDKKFLFLYKL